MAQESFIFLRFIHEIFTIEQSFAFIVDTIHFFCYLGGYKSLVLTLIFDLVTRLNFPIGPELIYKSYFDLGFYVKEILRTITFSDELRVIKLN